MDDATQAEFEAIGVSVVALHPDDDESLIAAGIARAASILLVSEDDTLNLAVGLRARMLNVTLRLVLRQLYTRLAEKIEQQVPDCTVLSLAAHSAASYAAAALNPACFFALQFPESDGPLVGFLEDSAEALGVTGLTVFEAERRIGRRILSVGARIAPSASALVYRYDTLVTFGGIVDCSSAGSRRVTAARAKRSVRTLLLQINPILRTIIFAAAGFFSLSYVYFRFILGKTWLAASFSVVETMTNVGFGEIGVTQRGPIVTLGALVAMLGGITFTSIFIGYVSSALTRAEFTLTQGLRRVRARGHVVVCGGGSVPAATLALLTAAGKRAVVIDPEPDAGLVRRARERDVDLLTGDPVSDDALDLCDIPNAAAVLALTGSDVANLEIALGARARSADVPLVVRMEGDAFARATQHLFGIATFSVGALGAPIFAALARLPGTRGHVHFGGVDHAVAEIHAGEGLASSAHPDATPLTAWRDGKLVMIRDLAQARAGDAVLMLHHLPMRDARRC